MLNIKLIKPPNKYSTRDHVYQVLKENIISLELEPGRSISEKEISELLSVSRTPVREAFVKLAQEELLEIYPQKGTTISLIDLKHVEEARFVREHLERAVVKEACLNFSNEYTCELESNLLLQKQCVLEKNYTKLFELDEKFHHNIALGAGKERIWTIIQQVNSHLNRIRMLSLAANYQWDVILSQHESIIEAIKNHDQEKADKVMEQHLKKLIFEQEELQSKYSNYFK